VSLESTLSPSSKGLKTTTWIFNKPWTEPTHHHQRQGHDLAYTQVDRPDHPTARTATADPNQILPEKRQKNSAKSARKKASSPTQPTILNLTVTVLPSTNTTLAGVAQSVERVALINSKEINLKVVGSSPTFGYSYHTSSSEQLFFCSFAVCFGWQVLLF
jgi:hypothetical protein